MLEAVQGSIEEPKCKKEMPPFTGRHLLFVMGTFF